MIKFAEQFTDFAIVVTVSRQLIFEKIELKTTKKNA
jgi:hypothetical protein